MRAVEGERGEGERKETELCERQKESVRRKVYMCV